MRKPLLVAAAAGRCPLAGRLHREHRRRRGGDGGDARAVAVDVTDDGCDVSAATAPSGHADVQRDQRRLAGHRVLPARRGRPPDRRRGREHRPRPDPRRSWSPRPPAPTSPPASPGMMGEGIRADFTVTDSGEDGARLGRRPGARRHGTTNYAAYVKDQSDQLLIKTTAVRRGLQGRRRRRRPGAVRRRADPLGADRDRRRVLRRPRPQDGRPRGRPRARARSGPAGTGSRRTCGPQRAEDYTPLTPAERAGLRRRPARQHHDPRRRACRSSTFTIDQIANGSRGLLEEVATGKVTGEEEYWSRTDLWDFQANVDGARVAFEGVKPIVEQKDPELAETLDHPVRRAAGAARRAARPATASCSTTT